MAERACPVKRPAANARFGFDRCLPIAAIRFSCTAMSFGESEANTARCQSCPFRASGERPSSRCDADKRDEIASPHRLPLKQRLLPYHADECMLHHGKFGSPMSALGQKQTSQRIRSMSALPPKADIGTQLWNVRFVPEADID